MPSGTRLVWMMTVSPSKVCSAPVIDMAVLHWIDSSHFVSKQGPAAVKLQSALLPHCIICGLHSFICQSLLL